MYISALFGYLCIAYLFILVKNKFSHKRRALIASILLNLPFDMPNCYLAKFISASLCLTKRGAQ